VLERALALGRTAVAAVGSWGQPVRPPRPPALVLPGGPRHRYTIGRESACDVSISDQTVSRWHADLRRDPGGWRLADLGSTNGTRLNGGRVTAPVLVRPGDLVSFGTATFVLARGTP
jgi:pSer/pThr/pTyr-binding forkhead associated (FHA) protein